MYILRKSIQTCRRSQITVRPTARFRLHYGYFQVPLFSTTIVVPPAEHRWPCTALVDPHDLVCGANACVCRSPFRCSLLE